MREKVITLAEKKPEAFWLLTAVLFYFLYRIPAVFLAREGLLSQTLLFVVLTLAVTVLTFWAYGEWDFGMEPANFTSGFSTASLLLLPIIGELLTAICANHFHAGRLVQLLLYSAGRGMFEAALFFGLLTAHMMRIWNGREFRGLASALTCGFLAALMVMSDILFGKTGAEVMVQAVIVFAMVSALSAIFIRTRNLWPCVAVLAFHHFAGGLYTIYEPDADGLLRHAISSHGILQGITIAVSIFILLLGIAITFYLVYLEMDEGEDERWKEARFDPVPATEMDGPVILQPEKETASLEFSPFSQSAETESGEENGAEELKEEELREEESSEEEVKAEVSSGEEYKEADTEAETEGKTEQDSAPKKSVKWTW